MDKRRADAKAKAKQILQGGLDIKAGEVRMEAERAQRMAMQEELVAGTVGRVQEMGLLPERYPTISSDQGNVQIAKTPEEKQLEKNSPIGENLLPPKPSAAVEIPGALQGVPIPSNPDLKQWTEEDRAKWGAMSPDQKKAWVASRPNVAAIANAEAQKAARPQAWWQN